MLEHEHGDVREQNDFKRSQIGENTRTTWPVIAHIITVIERHRGKFGSLEGRGG